jgi:uncharacterized membrane protein YkgB
MKEVSAGQIVSAEQQDSGSTYLSRTVENALTTIAAWIEDHNIPFLLLSAGMIVMLLWAGLFKMTAIGAQGIIPLVTHNPLISWQFKLFGPYIGSDLIGLTELTAAFLFIVGYLKAEAGILGGFITAVMFFITSTMIVTTPGAIITYHGMKYMSFIGLFLFKDVISFGVSFFLIGSFGRRARRSYNRS